MYKVEFCKERLGEQGHVIDEEVGRVFYKKIFSEDGRLLEQKIAGTLYGDGCVFSSKKAAEKAAKEFEDFFAPYPEFYRVTTEVYKWR